MEDQSDDGEGSSIQLACNVFLGCVFVSAFVANLLVLLVFYRKSGLRSVANRFVVNLMAINLLSCASLLPLSMADNVTPSERFLRVATELSSVFCSSVMIYAVLLIAVDQYFAVVDPLHYHRVVSSSKSTCMILSSWLVSAAFAVAAGVGDDVFRHEATRRGSSDRASTYSLVFCAAYALSVFVVPFALMCFIYYRICVAASGNARRTRTSCVSADESSARDRAGDCDGYLPQRETLTEQCGLLAEHANPSFVVTRPSPPREESADPSPPPLKPTLKNNSSFSKLSSLHIQFSEEASEGRGPRRHSNVSAPVADPEFENIPKSRSPSIQSNALDMRSPSPQPPAQPRSAISPNTRWSRSSSINSGSTRNPASRASSIRSTSSYIVHNIRRRISNASLFRYREDARAARISALVIVMALACWLPFFAVFCLRSGLPSVPRYLRSLSTALLLLSTVASPFLFAFRNRKIKKEIRKIVRLNGGNLGADCAKSFYKYNLSVDAKTQTTHLFLNLAGKKTPPPPPPPPPQPPQQPPPSVADAAASISPEHRAHSQISN